jgi:hypothetical protein
MDHTHKKAKRQSQKRLNIIKVLSGTKWGADSKTLIKIYNSLIRSILDYGSPLYMTSRNSALTMLDVTHNAGVRMASGAFRNSLINSILNITGEQPLHNRRNQLMLQYAVRTATNPNKPTYYTVFNIQYFENAFNNNKRLIQPMYKRIKEKEEELKLEINNILTREVFVKPP